MANTLSAAKRARQAVRRTSRNRKTRASVKAELKGIRAAIAGGKKDDASKLLSQVSHVLDKAAKLGRIHKNKANRHKSELASQIAAIK
jgi:small subunit ribosomal protein S20